MKITTIAPNLDTTNSFSPFKEDPEHSLLPLLLEIFNTLEKQIPSNFESLTHFNKIREVRPFLNLLNKLPQILLDGSSTKFEISPKQNNSQIIKDTFSTTPNEEILKKCKNIIIENNLSLEKITELMKRALSTCDEKDNYIYPLLNKASPIDFKIETILNKDKKTEDAEEITAAYISYLSLKRIEADDLECANNYFDYLIRHGFFEEAISFLSSLGGISHTLPMEQTLLWATKLTYIYALVNSKDCLEDLQSLVFCLIQRQKEICIQVEKSKDEKQADSISYTNYSSLKHYLEKHFKSLSKNINISVSNHLKNLEDMGNRFNFLDKAWIDDLTCDLLELSVNKYIGASKEETRETTFYANLTTATDLMLERCKYPNKSTNQEIWEQVNKTFVLCALRFPLTEQWISIWLSAYHHLEQQTNSLSSTNCSSLKYYLEKHFNNFSTNTTLSVSDLLKNLEEMGNRFNFLDKAWIEDLTCNLLESSINKYVEACKEETQETPFYANLSACADLLTERCRYRNKLISQKIWEQINETFVLCTQRFPLTKIQMQSRLLWGKLWLSSYYLTDGNNNGETATKLWLNASTNWLQFYEKGHFKILGDPEKFNHLCSHLPNCNLDALFSHLAISAFEELNFIHEFKKPQITLDKIKQFKNAIATILKNHCSDFNIQENITLNVYWPVLRLISSQITEQEMLEHQKCWEDFTSHVITRNTSLKTIDKLDNSEINSFLLSIITPHTAYYFIKQIPLFLTSLHADDHKIPQVFEIIFLMFKKLQFFTNNYHGKELEEYVKELTHAEKTIHSCLGNVFKILLSDVGASSNNFYLSRLMYRFFPLLKTNSDSYNTALNAIVDSIVENLSKIESSEGKSKKKKLNTDRKNQLIIFIYNLFWKAENSTDCEYKRLKNAEIIFTKVIEKIISHSNWERLYNNLVDICQSGVICEDENQESLSVGIVSIAFSVSNALSQIEQNLNSQLSNENLNNQNTPQPHQSTRNSKRNASKKDLNSKKTKQKLVLLQSKKDGVLNLKLNFLKFGTNLFEYVWENFKLGTKGYNIGCERMINLLLKYPIEIKKELKKVEEHFKLGIYNPQKQKLLNQMMVNIFSVATEMINWLMNEENNAENQKFAKILINLIHKNLEVFSSQFTKDSCYIEIAFLFSQALENFQQAPFYEDFKWTSALFWLNAPSSLDLKHATVATNVLKNVKTKLNQISAEDLEKLYKKAQFLFANYPDLSQEIQAIFWENTNYKNI